jgi:hypothetical protein
MKVCILHREYFKVTSHPFYTYCGITPLLGSDSETSNETTTDEQQLLNYVTVPQPSIYNVRT